MRDGFIKVAAGTPKIKVADCDYNAGQIIALMREAAAQGAKVLALPELCITGYTSLHLRRPILTGHPSPGGGGRPEPHSGGNGRTGHAHRCGSAGVEPLGQQAV